MRYWIAAIITAFVGVGLAQETFTGPAILSRGGVPSPRSGGDLFRIRPYVSFSATYDTGLANVVTDPAGDVPVTDGYGVLGTFGVRGYHTWRRSLLGLDYEGDYRHYPNNPSYSGIDQLLALGYNYQFSRRWTMTLRPAAGTFTRNYYFPTLGGFVDPAFSQFPTYELFDNRTYYLVASGDAAYQHSARLSASFGGEGFVHRRRSSSLAGMTGTRARGDIAYRLTRSTTLGGAYAFNRWEYTKGFGTYNIHTLGVDISHQFARRWELGLLAGAARVESEQLTVVPLDPQVALILGQTTGVEVGHLRTYVPNIAVRISTTGKRSQVSFEYRNGITPGNGVTLASRVNEIRAGFGYTATRYWSLHAWASGSRLKGFQNTAGLQGYVGAGGGVSRRLIESLYLNGGVEWRRYLRTNSSLDRDGVHVSMGLSYSPGEMPLALW